MLGRVKDTDTRQPAVAGLFYPGDERSLLAVLDDCLDPPVTPVPALVAVSPHAGYVYSGAVAGAVFARVRVPDRVVVLGPKHRRSGAALAAHPARAWRFPFGEVPIDEELTGAVAAETGAALDVIAHRDEHSLEVQVPFLWRRNPGVRLAALALGFLDLAALRSVGEGLARAVRHVHGPVLVVASTDMSHHIPQASAERLDGAAIERILALDPEGLYRTVVENDISMCGVVPTTAALFFANAMGAERATLVRYATSGDRTGDRSSVVGYAGLLVD